VRRAVAVVAIAVQLAAGCGGGGTPGDAAVDRCDWPMWGHSVERSFSYPCGTAISPETVADLEQVWFLNTDDAVTATPAVVDGVVYVGDWSGRFYAISLESGELVWSYRAEPHPRVYAGQIVSSATVADVGGTRTVYFGSGKTLYALRAEDGAVRWQRDLGRGGDDDPTEIESSPVVAGGLVIVGTDVHNNPSGTPAGVVALDAATGARRWMTTTAPTGGDQPTGAGCGDVWGSPSADVERGLVFVGTGNCTSAEGWGDNTEALLALDLETGERRWGFQPHDQNLDDLDFAGAPNLFEIDGRAVVGLGNKDAVYYVVDRETGELIWRRQVTEPGVPEGGSNYSFGGFIGPTAHVDGLIVGGTAVGGSPHVHALDAATGEIVWQQPEAGPTFAAALDANGVVFIGGIDFTLRAFDLRTGETLWSQEMQGAVSGGAVVVGDDLVAVAGMREPGSVGPIEAAGVYRFSLPGSGSSSTDAPTTGPDGDGGDRDDGDDAGGTRPVPALDPGALAQPCVASPCPLDFTLSEERVDGDVGAGTVWISGDPFRVEVRADGLGPPERWLRPGSTAARSGARAYAVYLSEGTDNPAGGLVCVLDADQDCTGDELPEPGATYDRISILAVDDPAELPSISEGFDRLVTTNALEVPLAPRPG
jgi:polyvinyl alcohol dehydrogenase (cytochrome)